MNNKIIGQIIKWVSIVFVAISVSMMFFGWITIADRKARQDLQSAIKSTRQEVNLDQDELDEAQDELDQWGIDIDIEKLVKQIRKGLNSLKDAKISPCEIATTGPTVYKIADMMDDKAMLKEIIGDEFDKVLDVVKNVKSTIIALEILFYITIVAGIVVIILHVIESKLPGISVIVLNLIWWIVIGVASHKINVYGEDELYLDDKILKLTSAPVWAFVLAALAAALWFVKDKIVIGGIGGASMAANYGPTGVTGGRRCPNCANMLNDSALFCPKCGTRFEEQSKMNNISSERGLFCSKCGAPTEADALFCPKCGTKYDDVPATEAQQPDADKEEQPEKGVFCYKCGAELDADTVFCHKCGTRVE